MANKKTNSSGDTLKERAREIGAMVGEVHVKARQTVEGVKAAVKATRAALSRKSKPKKAAKKTAKKKSASARSRKSK